MTGASWCSPNADPIADLRAAMDMMNGLVAPQVVYMSRRVFIRINKSVARARLLKRAYRRWRGRFMAQLRADEAAYHRENADA